MQDSTTANMVFSVADFIPFVIAGDHARTRRPDCHRHARGVGVFRDPQVCLQAGDEITIEIDGLGSITNPVTAA